MLSFFLLRENRVKVRMLKYLMPIYLFQRKVKDFTAAGVNFRDLL